MSASLALPSGWSSALIGDICSLTTGGTPKSSEKSYYQGGTIKWLVSGDVHRREIYDCGGRITEKGLNASNARPLPIGSVIIALNGQGKTRGTVAMLRTEATCNQSIVGINPCNTSTLLSEFLFWNLRGRYEEIRRMTGDDGNERRGLNMPLIRSIRIPIPPLDEQKRIVAALDQAFAAIERARANAEANLEDADILALRLREDLIQKSVAETSMSKLGDVCDFVRGPFGGSLKKSIFKKTGFAVYEQQHAIHRRFESFRYFVDQEKFDEMARFRVRSGDVIMSCSGTMGRVAVVPNHAPVGIINQALLKLSPSKLLLPEFLRRWMESAAFQSQLSANKLGVAIENVASVGTLKLLEIPILTLDKQAKIVEAMDDIDLACSRVRQRYDLKSRDTVDLRQSLLQAAFSGQLT